MNTKVWRFGNMTNVVTQDIKINVLNILNAKEILLLVDYKSYYFDY